MSRRNDDTWRDCDPREREPLNREGRPFRARPATLPPVEIIPPDDPSEAYMATRALYGARHGDPVGYGKTPEAAEQNLIRAEEAYYDE